MPRNSFIQMTKLHNVRGRIYYISSPKKQENLYAVYETTDRNFWTDLAKYNQAEFKKNGTEGKCIEARELIIALPESFTEYPPDRLLQIFTAYGDYQDSLKNWKQRYGEKPQSLHDRLISKKQDIKERELTRPYSPPNRGRSR